MNRLRNLNLYPIEIWKIKFRVCITYPVGSLKRVLDPITAQLRKDSPKKWKICELGVLTRNPQTIAFQFGLDRRKHDLGLELRRNSGQIRFLQPCPANLTKIFKCPFEFASSCLIYIISTYLFGIHNRVTSRNPFRMPEKKHDNLNCVVLN